jgi:hypothetical protein
MHQDTKQRLLDTFQVTLILFLFPHSLTKTQLPRDITIKTFSEDANGVDIECMHPPHSFHLYNNLILTNLRERWSQIKLH